MPKKRLDAHFPPDMRRHAARLARLDKCLAQNLPPSVNTAVKLAALGSDRRAVVYVRGGEWAAQLRLQQDMLIAILKSCGAGAVTAVVVKNRPLEGVGEAPGAARPRPPRKAARRISHANRDLLAATAAGIADARLAQSLRRLGGAT